MWHRWVELNLKRNKLLLILGPKKFVQLEVFQKERSTHPQLVGLAILGNSSKS